MTNFTIFFFPYFSESLEKNKFTINSGTNILNNVIQLLALQCSKHSGRAAVLEERYTRTIIIVFRKER